MSGVEGGLAHVFLLLFRIASSVVAPEGLQQNKISILVVRCFLFRKYACILIAPVMSCVDFSFAFVVFSP